MRHAPCLAVAGPTTPFFAGEEISIADFAIVGWVWRHERHKIDLADFPHLHRWYRGMTERDGVGRGCVVALKR